MFGRLLFACFQLSFSQPLENLPPGHIRHVMLYEFLRGTNAPQTSAAINNVYGKETTTQQTCNNWFIKFRSGDKSLQDQPGRGTAHKIDDNLLFQLLGEDSRLSTRELGDKLGVSHTAVENRLHALNFRLKFGTWLPHDLTAAQMAQRASIAAAHLSRYERLSFLPHIVTGDEKWITTVNLRRKRQWVGPGSTPSPDVKPEVHQHKIMLCVWWDMEGVIYWELLDDKATLNAALYSQQLDLLAAAVAAKRPKNKKVILLHDNARPHVAKLTRAKIHSLNWEILPHPAYSPDLAPSDYCLFLSMSSELASQHFDSIEAVKIWLQNYFDSKPHVFYEHCIRQLVGKWAKVIDRNGGYFN